MHSNHLFKAATPCTLFLVVVLAVGCVPNVQSPNSIKDTAIVIGRVDIPVPQKLSRDPLGNATVEIVDPKTGEVLAVAATDQDGVYRVEVKAGGPYLVRARKENLVALTVVPRVNPGQSYDAGIVDHKSTAVALVFQALVEKGRDPEDIPLEELTTSQAVAALAEVVRESLLAGEDPTVSQRVQNVLNVTVGSVLLNPSPVLSSSPTTGILRVPIFDIGAGDTHLLVVIRNIQTGEETVVSESRGSQEVPIITANTAPGTYEVFAFSGNLRNDGFWISKSGQGSARVPLGSSATINLHLEPASFSTNLSFQDGGKVALFVTLQGKGLSFFDRFQPILAYGTSSWNLDAWSNQSQVSGSIQLTSPERAELLFEFVPQGSDYLFCGVILERPRGGKIDFPLFLALHPFEVSLNRDFGSLSVTVTGLSSGKKVAFVLKDSGGNITVRIPESGGTGDSFLLENVLSGTYTVFAFAGEERNGTLWLEQSGKIENVTISQGTTSRVGVSLSGPFATQIVPLEEIYEGRRFTSRANITGSGVGVLFADASQRSAYFAYRLETGWTIGDYESAIKLPQGSNAITPSGDDAVWVTYSVPIPEVSEDTMMYYRIILERTIPQSPVKLALAVPQGNAEQLKVLNIQSGITVSVQDAPPSANGLLVVAIPKGNGSWFGGDFNYTQSITIPVAPGTYDVVVFAFREFQAGRFLHLASGKAENVDASGGSASCSITLQPFAITHSVPVSVTSGEPLIFSATVSGESLGLLFDGVENQQNGVFFKSYFAYSTESWNVADFLSQNIVEGSITCNTVSNSVNVSFDLTAPSNSRQLYCRFVLEKQTGEYKHYIVLPEGSIAIEVQ